MAIQRADTHVDSEQAAMGPALASTGSVPVPAGKAEGAPAQREAAFIPDKLAGAGLATPRTGAKSPQLAAPTAGGGKGGVAAEPAAPAAEGAAAEASSGAELFAGGNETAPDPAQKKTEDKLESAAPETAAAAEESEQAPEAIPETGAEAPKSPSEAVAEPSSLPDIGADLSPSSVEGGEADKPRIGNNNTPEAAERRQTAQLARMEQADKARVAEQHAEEQDQERAEEQQEQKAESGNVEGIKDAGLTPMEKEAGLAAVAENAGGEEGAAAAGGGGAAGCDVGDQQEAKAPDTSAMDSESGLATAAALPAGAAPMALAGVGSSVDNGIQQEGRFLQGQIPKVEVGGQGDGSAVQPLEEPGAAEKPRRTETGKAEPTPAPEPLPKAPPSAIQNMASPRISDSATGAVSADDASRVQSSIAAMPTSDPGLAVPAGMPPTLRLTGDADPAHIAEQKQEIDASILAQRNQGTAEIAAPAGENNIRARRPRESLKAQKLAVPGNAETGSVEPIDDAVGIIAEQKKGDEVRAAIAQAQGEVAAKKVEHQTRVAEEKSKTQQQLAGLQVENANQQDAVRLQARNEVSKAKADWSQAQRREIDQANEKTRAQLSSGNEKIAKEESQANQQATKHIAEGEREALQHKQEAETRAEQKKNEAEGESQGVFAGVASRVSSFFDALKKGLADIFEEARKLVRAAIEQAKKLAVAAIEKARQAVVFIIRAVGDALIAISETLLAAFPALRAKWRGFIEEKIRAAENRVNQLADILKKNAQKILDALGKGYEFLLDLHQKAIMAALDGARTVAMGAINFAKKVADALGPYVVLVKDIAKNPGQWISNLAAAVKDGIKNHLWAAFKTAVKEWFNQKLEQVLGLGTAIWNVLKKGGIALKEIGAMVWEGLKSAIPFALISILIEKLVAMIVPAAGAVMLIVQGIQAAWGSVQRIIAALGKFVAFLKAVRKGDAGPSFAEMLAAAAIVVVDFVSHWLLRKLRGPASKIGARIKVIAKKIMAKIKAVAKKAVGWVKGKAKGLKDKFAGWRERRKTKKAANVQKRSDPSVSTQKPPKKSKEEKARERLEKARRELPPKIEALLAKGISSIGMRARLLYWRIAYRLTRLEIVGSGRNVSIRATVNPSLDLVTKLLMELGPTLFKMIREIGRTMLSRPEAKAAMERIVEQRLKGKGKFKEEPIATEPGGAGALGQAADVAKFPSGKEAKDISSLPPGTARPARAAEYIEEPGGVVTERQGRSAHPGHIETKYAGHSGSYADIRAELDAYKIATGKSDADIAKAMISAQQTGTVPSGFEDFPNLKSLIRHEKVEMGRSSAHVVTGTLARELTAEGHMTTGELFGAKGSTMERSGAVAISSQAAEDVGAGAERKYAASRSATKAEVQQMLNTELELMSRYIFSKLQCDKPLVRDAAQLEKLIKKELHDYIEDMVDKGLFGFGSGH